MRHPYARLQPATMVASPSSAIAARPTASDTQQPLAAAYDRGDGARQRIVPGSGRSRMPRRGCPELPGRVAPGSARRKSLTDTGGPEASVIP